VQPLAHPGRQHRRAVGGEQDTRQVLRRFDVELPAVEGEELGRGDQRDAAVPPSQRAMVQEAVQHGACAARGVVERRCRVDQCAFGGVEIEQVENRLGVEVEHLGRDHDEIDDAEPDHDSSSCNRRRARS
jgi:hypothetical protein